jgi:hypothetical protein
MHSLLSQRHSRSTRSDCDGATSVVTVRPSIGCPHVPQGVSTRLHAVARSIFLNLHIRGVRLERNLAARGCMPELFDTSRHTNDDIELALAAPPTAHAAGQHPVPPISLSNDSKDPHAPFRVVARYSILGPERRIVHPMRRRVACGRRSYRDDLTPPVPLAEADSNDG